MEQNKLLLVALAIVALGGGVWYYQSKKDNHHCTCAKGLTQLRLDMRKLWEDHVAYTRSYTTSALANLADKDAVTKRLLQNQDDIGNAIKPYYGEEAGNALAKLLREHILIAADVVADAMTNNTQKLNQDNARWKNNANEIAAFLSKANPNWAEKDLQDMLYKHLDLITNEVTSRLKKDWVADISFCDKNHEHMLKLADALADGIAKQFPDKFK